MPGGMDMRPGRESDTVLLCKPRYFRVHEIFTSFASGIKSLN